MTDLNFQPNWASPPGVTISRLMDRAHIHPADLAPALEITLNELRAYMAGSVELTPEIAEGLSKILGGSARYWLKRDEQFRSDALRIPIERHVDEQWLKAIPYADLVKNGWLQATKSDVERTKQLLDFFGFQHPLQWTFRYPEAGYASLFRTSQAFENRHEAVAAWLRQGERVAARIDCAPWDRDKFRERLTEIRGLTRNRHPSQFFSMLRKLCAECGVAVVAAPTPSGCFASGATQFLSRQKALLMVSFRFRSDDQFWFSFFHEAGHLVLHDIDAVFIDDALSEDSNEEREANDFARDFLVPPDRWQELLQLPRRYDDVIRFAVQLGIAPGIVLGQLQKLKKFPPYALAKLRRYYDDGELQSAFNL